MPAATNSSVEFSDFESFNPLMTNDELQLWFSTKFGGSTSYTPPDILMVSQQFYQLGAFSRALTCLQFYLTRPSAVVSSGRHLLAYCYLSLNELESALNEFKYCCVNDDIHQDWQLVVELSIEIEQKIKSLT